MSENYRIFKSTAIVTIVGGGAQVIGFFIPVLIAKYFGASSEVDAYYFAISVPNLIIGIIIGGSLKIIFIPIFIKEKKENPTKIKEFIGQITSFLLVLSLFISAIFFFLTKSPAFNFLADAKTQILAKDYIVYSLPLIPLTVIFQLYNAVYNSYQKFALLEASNAIKFLITIVFIYIYHEEYGLLSAIFGQIIGQFIVLVFSALILRFNLNIRPSLNFRFQRAQLKLLQMSSLALGAFVFAQLNIFALKIIAGLLPAGSISVIGYAERLSIIPSFIIGSSFSVILTSYWSQLLANNQTSNMFQSFNKTISTLFIILIPTAAGLFYLSQPIVNLVFFRGNFDRETAVITASVFSLFIIQIIPTYYNNVLSRVLHINQDLKYMFWFSCAAFALNTTLMYCLTIMTPLGILGIPTGLIIGRVSTVMANTIYIHKKFVAIQTKSQLINFSKIIFSSAGMIFFIYLKRLLLSYFSVDINQFVALTSDVLVGLFFYILILKILKHQELDSLLSIIGRKLAFN